MSLRGLSSSKAGVQAEALSSSPAHRPGPLSPQERACNSAAGIVPPGEPKYPSQITSEQFWRLLDAIDSRLLELLRLGPPNR